MSTSKTTPPARTLSHSQLETWGQCPRRWYLTKVAHVPEAPSEHLALGSALHSVLEADGNRKMEGHAEGYPLHEMAEAFEALLEHEMETRDPLGLLDPGFHAILRERGLAMLRAYTAEMQRRIQPIACEEQLTAEVPGSSIPGAIMFRGTLDAIIQNDAGDRCIVDYKTAGRRWARGIEDTKDQATAYTWLDDQRLSLDDRAAIRRHRVAFVVFATDALSFDRYDCTVEIRPTERDEDAIRGYLSRARIASARMAAIGDEEDAEARTGPLCGWCGCLGACQPGQAWLRLHNRQPAVPVITPQMAAAWPAHAKATMAAADSEAAL